MSQHPKANSQSAVITWPYILLIVLIIILPAGGFYGGMKYQQKLDQMRAKQSTPLPTISPDK